MEGVSNLALFVTIGFMIIPLAISYWQHLQLEKEILWSSLRGFIQLLLMGYVITLIFSVERWEILTLLVVLMIAAAALNSSKRGAWLAAAWVIAFAGIALGEATALLLWLTFDVVPYKAQFILPMSGMVIGNSLVIAGLSFERMYSEFQQTKELLLAKLALGATYRQGSQELIVKTIKAALIPSIDSFKTIGLVHLPGMMTGMIIAGASPLDAVRFQIIIMFSQMASNVIAAITVTLLSYKTFYTRAMF